MRSHEDYVYDLLKAAGDDGVPEESFAVRMGIRLSTVARYVSDARKYRHHTIARTGGRFYLIESWASVETPVEVEPRAIPMLAILARTGTSNRIDLTTELGLTRHSLDDRLKCIRRKYIVASSNNALHLIGPNRGVASVEAVMLNAAGGKHYADVAELAGLLPLPTQGILDMLVREGVVQSNAEGFYRKVRS